MSENYTNLDQTSLAKLAEEIGGKLKKGDVIALRGDLGAGKTTFTRHLVNSLAGSSFDVTSPTFNLVHIYNTKLFDIWHFDLYRLAKSIDLFELGIEEALDNGVSIIEWPEIAMELLPKNHIDIHITMAEDKDLRNITVNYT